MFRKASKGITIITNESDIILKTKVKSNYCHLLLFSVKFSFIYCVIFSVLLLYLAKYIYLLEIKLLLILDIMFEKMEKTAKRDVFKHLLFKEIKYNVSQNISEY